MTFLWSLLLLMMTATNTAEIAESTAPPHYDIKGIVDLEKHQIKVEMTITFSPDYVSDGKVGLMIAQDAGIDKIEGENLSQFKVDSLDESLAQITLLYDKLPDSELSVHLKYSLTIPPDHQINRITKGWLELNVDSFWHPLFNFFPNLTYRLELNIGEPYQVITGDVLKENDGRGNVVIENRIPRLDISFSAASTFYSAKGKYAEVYSPVANPKIDTVRQSSEKALRFLKKYINEPGDFKTVRKVVISPRKDVGYARKNYIVLSDVSKENEKSLSAFLSHEFSHYWFSEANMNTANHWLTESFAEYLSMIYMRETYGEEVFKKDIEKKQDRIKDDKKKLSEYDGRPSYLALYHRGPLVLYLFEQYLGKKKFKKLLNRMVDLNIKTNEELFAAIKGLFGEAAVEELKKLRATI